MCFTQTRKQAHRLHILLGLMGLKVGELHGELSQNQRLENLRYTHTHTQDMRWLTPGTATEPGSRDASGETGRTRMK